MAHECPDCYMMCYCGGDIDDLLLNYEDDVVGCTHCLGKVDEDDYEEFDSVEE